ncbi:hypothetical protein [Brevundimonas sp.]|uniref:hypothetical protein n=1 Tax=Brevundimonas sp. TaxID=1871086 RepID=UPI00356398CC
MAITFDTRAEAAAATIAASEKSARIAGLAVAGDGGDGLYVRVGSQPNHGGKFQSADGGWWELVAEHEGGVRALQVGAVADGVTVNSTTLTTALRRYGKVFLDRHEPGLCYLGNVYLASNETLWGDDIGAVGDPAHPGTVLKGTANRNAHEPVVGNVTRRPGSNANRDRNLRVFGFTIDGDKAHNSSQGEWGHGLQLYAVDTAHIDVRAINCRGDGAVLAHGYDPDAGGGDLAYCSNIFGRVVSEDCYRQGVAVIAGENIRLQVQSFRARLFAFDIENDMVGHVLRNIVVDVYARDCGTAGVDSSGGVAVYGVAGQPAEDVTLSFQISGGNGTAVFWRQAVNARLSGSISASGMTAFACGAEGAGNPSSVYLDVDVDDAFALGRIWDNGGRIDGAIRQRSELVGSGLQLRDLASGDLNVQLTKGSTENGYGLLVYESSGLLIRGKVSGFRAQGVQILGTSVGNRFWIDCEGNNTSGFHHEVEEGAGGDDNIFFGLRNGVSASLSGPLSRVEYETVPGPADRGDAPVTLAPRSDPRLNLFKTALTANRTVSLSTVGAVKGDCFRLVRTGGGAFNLNVGSGPLKSLSSGQWCEATYTGTAWELTAGGPL